MTFRQAGFLLGFLIAWLLWLAGFWVTLGAIALGLFGYAAARLLDGSLDLGELSRRLGSSHAPR